MTPAVYRTLVVANTAEAFLSLIQRYSMAADRERRLWAEHRLGDRALLWDGDGKVVITSLPAAHCHYLTSRLSYRHILNLYPVVPSPSLCTDILHDARLFAKIREVLGGGAEVRLLSYVASDELYPLIHALEASGVRLCLVETPRLAGVMAARRFDTKSGFRAMCSEWATRCRSLRLPAGEVCFSYEEAACAAASFLAAGRPCVCKADRGESGVGLVWLDPSSSKPDTDAIEQRLKGEPAFGDDPIVVEAVIPPPREATPGLASPSIEAYVSPSREVSITYTCLQLFDSTGSFSGVLIDHRRLGSRVLEEMKTVATFIGSELAGLGYVGHFDLDFVLDPCGTLYVVEGNPRRTGGTHVHEAAGFLVGGQYQNEVAVMSRDSVRITSDLVELDALLESATGTLFPLGGEPRGVVPTIVSDLGDGVMGYKVIAANGDDAARLERAFLKAVRPTGV